MDWLHVKQYTAGQLAIFSAFRLSAGASRTSTTLPSPGRLRFLVLALTSSLLDVSSFAPCGRAKRVASRKPPLGRRLASSFPQLLHSRLQFGPQGKDEERGLGPGVGHSQARCRSLPLLRFAGVHGKSPPVGND